MHDHTRRSRLQDVAARAGVSPITVSRVLRMPHKVAPATRHRVEAVIKAIDYIPNAHARSLASNQTRLVVAIFPNLQNPLFPDTISGLSEVLNDGGLSLVVGSVGRSANAEEILIASVMAHRPCAMFLHRTVHTEWTRRVLAESGMIVVEGGDLVVDPIDAVVSYSHQEAALALTTMLVSKGRSNLVFVGSVDSDRHSAHFAGYCAALEAGGLPALAQLPIQVPHSYESGRQIVHELLRCNPALDGIVFASATSAAGALLECHNAAIAVPQSLSVVSLDDSDLAPNLTPPLTAVQFSRLELGRRAAQIIIDRLTGRPGPRRVQLDFSIAVRGSD